MADKYKIVKTNVKGREDNEALVEELVFRVNQHIKQGFHPVGGLQVISEGNRIFIVQAVVKR